MIAKHSIQKELYKLLDTFFLNRNFFIDVKCLEFYNAYNPKTDEVVTYKYKVHIIVKDKLYVYDGWCYDDELEQIALGIFSHWLLDNYKIYDGESTAWYNMYTCFGNIVEKEEMRTLNNEI